MPNFFTKQGYMLTELIVAIAVVAVLVTVVMISQSRFNRQVTLNNLAHEVAFVFREAQLNAVNVRRSPDGTLDDRYDVGYGVSVDRGANQLTKYVNEDQLSIYSQGTDSELGVMSLPAGFSISDLCYETSSGSGEDCETPTRSDVLFERPSLSALIGVNDGGWKTATRVILTLVNTQTAESRRVVIESSGQIYTYVE